jgi:hypothetical protein
MYEYYSVKCKALTNGRYCEKSFDLPGSTLLSGFLTHVETPLRQAERTKNVV